MFILRQGTAKAPGEEIIGCHVYKKQEEDREIVIPQFRKHGKISAHRALWVKVESNTKHGEATGRGKGVNSNVFSLRNSMLFAVPGSREVVVEKPH